MENIINNISQILGVAIIHSLWQGLLIFLLLSLILLVLPGLSSSRKHNLAFTALVSVTLWFLYTLLTAISQHTWIEIKYANVTKNLLPFILDMPVQPHHNAIPYARYDYNVEWLLPYIAIFYLAGLLFNAGRLVWARKKINTIRKSIRFDALLEEKLVWFAKMLHIQATVKIGLCKLIDVPCVIGYLKPVIFLPLTLSTYLSTEEIEIIILHELAHIKRNDYLVNLLQQIIITLLFFNPFALLINRVINSERENACDDIVIRTTQKPLVYVHALLKLEQNREHNWQLTVAATGKKYHLLNRIERMMETNKPVGNARHIIIAVLLFTVSVTSIAWLNPILQDGKISIRNVKKVINSSLAEVRPTTDTSGRTAPKNDKVKTPEKGGKHNFEADTVNAYRNDPITNDFQLLGYDDPKADQLLSVIEKYGDAIKSFDETGENKRLLDSLKAAEKTLHDYRNDILYDKLNEDIRNAGKDFTAKWGGDDGRNEQLGQQIKMLGNKVGNYYGSNEFKTLDNRLQKKYGIDPNKHYDELTEKNYQAYKAELSSKLPVEIKNATEEMKTAGLKMHQLMNSDEYKADAAHIKKLIDSMLHFRSPETEKKYQQAVSAAAEKWSAYNQLHADELKRDLDSIKFYGDKLHAYRQSPESKLRIKQWRDQMRTALGNDYEKLEHPDRPENTSPK